MLKRKGKGVCGEEGRGAAWKRRERQKNEMKEKREVRSAWGGTFTGHLEFGAPPPWY